MTERQLGARQPDERRLFGKLPSRGDFVARGLDGAAQDALDAWLSAEMRRAQDRFGAEFPLYWAAAPAWNFVEQEDGQWRGGALCASLDSAGRAFPLLLSVAAADPSAAAVLSAGCLTALGLALAQGWGPDELIATDLSAGGEVAWKPAQAGWALVAEQGPVLERVGHRPAGILVQMMEFAP